MNVKCFDTFIQLSHCVQSVHIIVHLRYMPHIYIKRGRKIDGWR